MFTGLVCIDILMIATIVVVLVDLLDIPTTFLFKPIWKLLTKMPYRGWNFKPFSCSLCTTFWLSIIYLLVFQKFTCVTCLLTLLISYFSFIIKDIIKIVELLITKVLTKITLHIDE